MGKIVTLATKGEVRPGTGKVCEVEGRCIALFNVGGAFYALDNTCKHRGGPLGEGDLEGSVVTCPWHGWQYDVTSGKNVLPNPTVAVDCFKVTVEGDNVCAEI